MKSALSPISSEYVNHILDTHFNPKYGTPYWIERQKKLKYKNHRDVNDWQSFKEIIGFSGFPEMAKFEQDTRFMPVETFIPKKILADTTRKIWVSQTGGTTGVPKNGCWDSEYWAKVLDFTDEFLDMNGFPKKANWLFMGPMGPHTTGRLIVSIAENRGGKCFTIDLDPRFVKIAVREGNEVAYKRYLQHIWHQTETLLKYQNIDIVFSTSRLLEMAPEYINLDLFKKIKGIVHAGTALDEESNQLFKEQLYKNIPILGLYGTSTTGISYQAIPTQNRPHRIVYIPSSPYIIFEIVNEKNAVLNYEEEGTVATYRLTEDFLIPGFWERDRAKRVKPFGMLKEIYNWDWVGDLYSPETDIDKKLDGVY
jgi:thienamycin biosynthesis protein ThnN